MSKRIWIDLLNPSHPLFFRPVVSYLEKEHEIRITIRERGETIHLSRDLGLEGDAIGKDHEGSFRKIASIALRTLELSLKVRGFDIALSFENPMSVIVARMKKKRSILLLDNDLKYKYDSRSVQKIESNVKTLTNDLIIPGCSREGFQDAFRKSRIETYPGYKEDIYIADHQPDEDFSEKVPFTDYILIRPEALASFYVKGKKSLVASLIDEFSARGENILFLPRDRSDWKYSTNENIYIPQKPLNGLDLIHNSKAVLTGSGTMAREAAIMGKKAVSFFPNRELLSVDMDLIEKKRMIHSRDVATIIDHIENSGSGERLEDPKKVQKVFMDHLRCFLNS